MGRTIGNQISDNIYSNKNQNNTSNPGYFNYNMKLQMQLPYLMQRNNLNTLHQMPKNSTPKINETSEGQMRTPQIATRIPNMPIRIYPPYYNNSTYSLTLVMMRNMVNMQNMQNLQTNTNIQTPSEDNTQGQTNIPKITTMPNMQPFYYQGNPYFYAQMPYQNMQRRDLGNAYHINIKRNNEYLDSAFRNDM
jgi:hypothetical protein